MGPAVTTTAHPPVPPRPDYRLAARSVKDAWRRRLARWAAPGPCPARGRSPGSAAAGEQGRPRPQAEQQARAPVRYAPNRPGIRAKDL